MLIRGQSLVRGQIKFDFPIIYCTMFYSSFNINTTVSMRMKNNFCLKFCFFLKRKIFFWLVFIDLFLLNLLKRRRQNKMAKMFLFLVVCVMIARSIDAQKCPEDKVHEKCGPQCPERCPEYDQDGKLIPPLTDCSTYCFESCFCKRGYVFTKNDRCVLKENCPKP